MVSLASQYTLKSSVIFPDVFMKNAGVHELTGGLFLLNSVMSCSHCRSFFVVLVWVFLGRWLCLFGLIWFVVVVARSSLPR